MSDEDVAAEAKERGVTRAMVSMEKAEGLDRPLIFAIGNAPTALIALDELIKKGRLAPKLIIGVPVGFVNVVESKELIIASSVPHIVARGRKGGSNVAALNASAQELSGAIKVGSNSSLTLKLTDGSSFEGYIDGKITNASGATVSTEVGTVSVTLDASSTWTLTGDSYVTDEELDALLGKGELFVLPEQALTVTKILDAIYRSAESGQTIYFDD